MDLYSMYLPDALSYTSFRSSAYYRDYETQPFESKRKACDYKERQQTAAHSHNYQLQTKQQRKESCPFCKEEKRRPLGAYLRSKGNTNHKDIITEEEQESEEQIQEDTKGKETAKK